MTRCLGALAETGTRASVLGILHPWDGRQWLCLPCCSTLCMSCPALCDPWTAAHQASVLHHLPEFAQMPSVLLSKIPPTFCWFSITTFSSLSSSHVKSSPSDLYFSFSFPPMTETFIAQWILLWSSLFSSTLAARWCHVNYLAHGLWVEATGHFWAEAFESQCTTLLLVPLPQWVGSYWLKWLPPKMGIITGTWGGQEGLPSIGIFAREKLIFII